MKLISAGRGKNIFCSHPESFFYLFLLIFLLVFNSCRSEPTVREDEISNDSFPVLVSSPGTNSSSGSVVEELRRLTERGTPSSILEGLEIIQNRNLSGTEFGRVMTAVNVTLFRILYPSIHANLPPVDPPLTHSYSRILREAERGVYMAPSSRESADFLELTLPFLSYYNNEGRNINTNQYLSALPDLERALIINRDSVLAMYFIGTVYERTGSFNEAHSWFSRAWELFPDTYPVALGLVRVMDALGRTDETIPFLQNLVITMPDNFRIKRQLALAYYNTGDWSRAETAVAEVLQINARDADFVLMRAHILVEQGRLVQAQAPLDIYATINPNNRLYLFLRARIQAEAFNNRDSALNYLRSIIRSSPDQVNPDEMIIYAIRLLMESPRTEDQEEGRLLLSRFLSAPLTPIEIISLSLDDAVRREAWTEARPLMNRLLEERRSSQDLMSAYIVEKETGNNAQALSYARELYDRDRNNEEGIIAYITALIDTGRRDEAAVMIESRLTQVTAGTLRSRYFFLRSRVRTNEELALNDLRSSLFDDPRNLDSLISMYEIYFRRRDERRADYYLRQALALAPNDQRLRRYEAEFRRTFN